MKNNDINNFWSWTDPVQIQGAFGNTSMYSFGTKNYHQKPEIFKKVYLKSSIWSQKFAQRVKQLQSFSHENYVKVLHKETKKEKIHSKEIINEFTVVSQYIESMPVSNFIKQLQNLFRRKNELYLSNFISIVQQMTNLMSQAQKKHIFHFHLNADSFLFIQSESDNVSEIFLKICDWGYQNEIFSRKQYNKLQNFLKKMCKSSMFQYLHPQLLFEQNNEQLYKDYKSKYDIWSFGIILYRLAYLRRPFENKGSFSPQILEKFYKGKIQLQVQKNTLLGTLIQKMLTIKNGFNAWSQIKAFLIQNGERTQTDFYSINLLYQKQIKLISYLLQIYKLVTWNLINSANCFWYENKQEMKTFLIYFMKIIQLLHSKKFLQRYGFRMMELSEDEKKKYDKIGVLIDTQSTRKGLSCSKFQESETFFKDFEKLAQFLVALCLRIDGYSSQRSEVERSSIGVRIRQPWESMKGLKEFSQKVLEARRNIKNYNRNIFHFLFNIQNE